MKIDPETLKKAEKFADADEAEMRSIGANSDYFCSEQRQLWRLEAVRAYLGLQPGEEIEVAEPNQDPSHRKTTV